MNDMKRTLLLVAILALALSCKKTTTTNPGNSNNNNNNNNGCGDGFICFNLDGDGISKQGGGYEFSDTFLFVKYEEGTKQLSIDIFGQNSGNYNVNDKRKKGNARIYYFPAANNMYMAETGSLNVASYDAANRKITGSFSGTLYKYDSNSETFTKTDSLVIKDGKFTSVILTKG